MEIGLLIKNFDRTIKCLIEKRFKLLGITSTQAFIISFIYNSKRDIVQRDVEENFNLKRSTISEALSLMEKNDLIIRVKKGRTNIIRLTDKAISIHNDIIETLSRLEADIRKDISNDELDLFINVLGRMKNNLEEDIKNA